MCVTVCNIGHDQNQQFICNERKAAQLASVFQTSNITTNNRFCNQINTYIMHNIRAYIANDPGSRHRQQTVISANAVFCHRIFLLLISIQSLQLLADLVCSWSYWGISSLRILQSWHVTTVSQTCTGDGRDKKVGAPWQHPTPLSRPPLVSQLWLWPLIGQQGLVPHPATSLGWTLFTLRWFVTDPDIDWRNFNSIIDTETLDLVTGPVATAWTIPRSRNKTLTHSPTWGYTQFVT